MKAWQKGATLGGLWGLFCVLLTYGMSAVKFTSAFPSIFDEDIIFFFPAFIPMEISRAFGIDRLSYLFLFFGILSGALIGLIIGVAVEKLIKKTGLLISKSEV
jgi:hypothetical protein